MKALLRKILSPHHIFTIKSYILSLKLLIYRFFGSQRWLSRLYYGLFSSEFGRECQSVLQGKIRYHESHRSYDMGNSALLRRNVHRLEKGLIMQPRKPSFAANYIEETVRAYEGMCSSSEFCGEERSWAHDVLNAYFNVVKDTPPIKRARETFQRIESLELKAYIPYSHSDKTKTDISTEQLHNLFLQRRSTRWFKPDNVEQEKVDKAIELASLAPSACNRQPFSFYVAQDQKDAVEIAKMAGGTGGFAENIPVLIAVVGDLSAYPFERDRHLIYIDGSLAAMQLMLAFETLGLSTCPINWPDVEVREKQIINKLKLQCDQRVIMLIAVGYGDGDGMIPFSSKKTVSSLKVDV
ncbi:nitroreductase family protein [Planctobacterium marinum]